MAGKMNGVVTRSADNTLVRIVERFYGARHGGDAIGIERRSGADPVTRDRNRQAPARGDSLELLAQQRFPSRQCGRLRDDEGRP